MFVYDSYFAVNANKEDGQGDLQRKTLFLTHGWQYWVRHETATI
jgi:hypothetical protein